MLLNLSNSTYKSEQTAFLQAKAKSWCSWANSASLFEHPLEQSQKITDLYLSLFWPSYCPQILSVISDTKGKESGNSSNPEALQFSV